MQSSREKKQLEIIQAAVKVFGTQGFYLGKMEDVAKEAGMGKATIYEYFSSKNELFQHMLGYFSEKYIEGARAATAKEATIRMKLISLADYNIDFVSKQANTLEQVFSRPENISSAIKPWVAEMKYSAYSLIYEIIEKGIASKELNPEIDKKIAALTIVGAMNSISTQGVLSKNEGDMKINSAAMVDMLLMGISNK